MKNKSGFSLLEVIISMVILSSGVILLVSSWANSYKRLNKTQVQFEMAALLERKMVELRKEYEGKPLESIDEEKAEDFGEDYPQYSWKMKSQELEFPDLTALLVSEDGGATQEMLTLVKTMTEHFNKSVKEVKVTVIHKNKGNAKPIEFSVTTYFVDYDKEIAMPGAGGISSTTSPADSQTTGGNQ
ncbi:MAG: type II secretion system protein [Pseudobdellovibrionaceae bacterium]